MGSVRQRKKAKAAKASVPVTDRTAEPPANGKPVSPFSTGAGGTRFELLVATYYVAEMLRDKVARGAGRGPVRAVQLQQQNRGRPVDDVVVVCGGAAESTLSLQVKHSLRFTVNNHALEEALGQCWQWFCKPGFDPGRDEFGIAFGEASNIEKVRRHLPGLLDWARTSETAAAFAEKVDQFKDKAHYWRVFRTVIGRVAGRPVSDDELWRFLRVFHLVSFDFANPDGRDAIYLANALREVVPNSDVDRARDLGSVLFIAASDFAKAGGELTVENLSPRLGPDVRARLPEAAIKHSRSIIQRLRDRVSRQLTKQEKSKKYIPAVFVESTAAKDVARAFCNPVLFLGKVLDDLRFVDTSFLNRLLGKLNLPLFDLVPHGIAVAESVNEVPARCDQVVEFCDANLAALAPYQKHGSEELVRLASPAKARLATEIWYQVQSAARSVRHTLERARGFAHQLRGGLLILRSPAGQGKTNFVCDLARVLVAYDVPTVFLTGKELAHAPLDDLLGFIVRLGVTREGSIEENVDGLRLACEKHSAPLVVIIDAINEHPKIPAFATSLEELIELLLAVGFVRVVLTCRSEYFDQRFGNLQGASFAEQTHYLYDVHRHMDERKKDRMLRIYLRFFRISAAFGWPARRKLRDDPLLLRVFCEAYAPDTLPKRASLPIQVDLYKDALFAEYLHRKYEELVARRVTQGRPLVGSAALYEQLLMKIVGEMLQGEPLEPVPVSRLEPNEHELLEDLLHEDVIVCKDLAARTARANEYDEVIAFPFDELRDYLIARYLTTVTFPSSEEQFIRQLNGLIQPRKPAAEGVARFVVYAARRVGNDRLYELIRHEDWFQDVFLDCVFGIEDDLVTDEDVAEVRARFLASARNARLIVTHLVFRWRPGVSRQLHIGVLFDILDGLTEEHYMVFVVPIFDSSKDRYGVWSRTEWPIENLAGFVVKSVDDAIAQGEGEQTEDLVRLLLYLLRIQGPGDCCPARDAFLDIAARHRALAWRVLRSRLAAIGAPYTATVWDLAGDLTRALRETPSQVFETAISAWRAFDGAQRITVRVDRVVVEVAEYLDAAREYAGRTLPSDVEKEIQRVSSVYSRRWL